MDKITAFKGFDSNLQCRGFQFEIGATYEHVGEVKKCSAGFHVCEYPIHIFDYYAPAGTRFAIVEASGTIDRETDGDTKIACGTLHVKTEIFIPEIVASAIKWITDLCVPSNASHSTGDQSASSATGYQSASSATGYRSASSATGDRSASSATGYQSASSATGDRSASSATGFQSASSATGYQSASSATGFQSASSATGFQSASEVSGANAVAMNIGILGKARAGKDGAIVLCNHDENGNIRFIRASKVGENGIAADTWYRLNDEGEFVNSED